MQTGPMADVEDTKHFDIILVGEMWHRDTYKRILCQAGSGEVSEFA